MDNDRLARTGETPADWADQLALDICADVQGRRHKEALSLVASRLRLVRCEGEGEGLRKAAQAIASPISTSLPSLAATLQRDYQLDVDERGIDGWGP